MEYILEKKNKTKTALRNCTRWAARKSGMCFLWWVVSPRKLSSPRMRGIFLRGEKNEDGMI